MYFLQINTGNAPGVWSVFKTITATPHNNIRHLIKYFLFQPRQYCGLQYAAHYHSRLNQHSILLYADEYLIKIPHLQCVWHR